jgi:AraC-like DNA-binding protein
MSAASTRVTFLMDGLSRLGIDVSSLFCSRADPSASTQSPAQLWEHVRPMGARSQVSWLEERALELTGDPAIALRLGALGHGCGAGPDAGVEFGIVGQLAASCPTLGDALELAAEYAPLILDGTKLSLRRDGSHALLMFACHAENERSSRFWTEVAMARFVRFGALFGGQPGPTDARGQGGEARGPTREQSIEAWFNYPAPAHVAEYERVLSPCRVRFEMGCRAFVFPGAWLDRAQPSYDRALYELLKQEAGRAIGRLAAVRVAQRVRAVLSSLRLEARPEMACVAEMLGTSERALRRRLAAEGVCFRELVDDVQRERALVLGKDPGRCAEDISRVLGFSEVSAYHRAFKRWTGLTPAQYRLAQREVRHLPLSRASAC